MCATSPANMPLSRFKGEGQPRHPPVRVGLADVSRCHWLLEQCLVRELTQLQSMVLLQHHAGIPPLVSGCGEFCRFVL